MRRSVLFLLAFLVLAFTVAPAYPAAAPEPAAGSELPSYCFVVYGDSRTGHDTHRRVAQAILDAKPAAVFHTGDMVSKGDSEEDWKEFNQITATLREKAEFFPTLGNHEGEDPRYFSNFGIPKEMRWYSVERGGIHLAMLDAYSSLKQGSPQLKWLEEDLSRAGTPFLAVVIHDSPYSSGFHQGDSDLREALVPLLEKFGVDVVFAGHDHDYERLTVEGITYIVTGGGGAPTRGMFKRQPGSRAFSEEAHFVRVCVERAGMIIEAITPNKTVLDRTVIPLKVRPAPVAPDRKVNCCGH